MDPRILPHMSIDKDTYICAYNVHYMRDRQIWFGNQPKLLKQVKLVASELRAPPPKNEASGFARGSEASEASSFALRPLKMKQAPSPEALKQVKLVASELRASPPKNEASGFARGSETSEASSFGASELRASPPKNEASGFARGSEASEASSFGASRFAPSK